MHRARSIQGRARPADDFNRFGLFVVRLEQVVDVAKAGGTDGDAVLEEEKCAAGASGGEGRRTDGRQAFLAVAAWDERTGNASGYFSVVSWADGLQVLT